MSEFADWTRAFVMMAHDGTFYRPVLVDDLGNLYALLRGETVDEELKTVRLDDQGRLSAFIIDSTDAWGAMLSIGNAELAARLGSPVIYEQSGRVQFFETFEHGLQHWTVDVDGLGAGVAISPGYCASKGYSCKMTAGSTDPWKAEIRYTQGLLPEGKVGLSFVIASAVEFNTFEFKLTLYDGVFYKKVWGKLDDAANKLWVRNDMDVWQEVGTADVSSGDTRQFYFVKLVADLSTGIYSTLRFNQQWISLTAIDVFEDESDNIPVVELTLALYSNAGDNDVAYVDNVIFTVAEP